MRTLPLDIGTLHFVGIGGIGMSGIAEVLHNLGYSVQGSDMADGANVQRLRKLGIRIAVGHKAENITAANKENVAVVVTSSAVKQDNPEVSAAREHGIPVIRRAEMLAELMRLKWSVAVGGTHGKTTTTSLVGCLLEGGDFDPTIINGGIVNAYGTNTRLGQGEWMVVEADESDGSFTRLPATIAIVTNIDPEHMDHYKTFDDLRDAFRTFVENIPFYGFAVVCLDHPEVQSLIPKLTDRRIITYGFNPQADVHAASIKAGTDGFTYDVSFNGSGHIIRDIRLPMFGKHNVLNSLAAITVAHELGISDDKIRTSLAGFKGVKRRFTKTGEAGGITVIDDYGHHPVEIAAVLNAARTARASEKNKIIAVMQPHRYTRVAGLFDEFCTCFNDADAVIVADIYPAGEDPIEGISRETLVQGLKDHGHKSVTALAGPEDLAATIAKIARPGDMVICLGAGNITSWAHDLPEQLEKILPPRPRAVEAS